MENPVVLSESGYVSPLYSGFVKVADIMTVPLLSTYSEETLIEEFDKAVSDRGHKLYEMKTENGEVYVRSVFRQRFERVCLHKKKVGYTESDTAKM